MMMVVVYTVSEANRVGACDGWRTRLDSVGVHDSSSQKERVNCALRRWAASPASGGKHLCITLCNWTPCVCVCVCVVCRIVFRPVIWAMRVTGV